MSVTRTDLTEALSGKEARLLSAVLSAADVRHDPTEDAEQLAARLTGALWWRTHTPLGQVAMPDTLDQLVDRTARRLKVALPDDADAWERLDKLTRAVLPDDTPLKLSDLSPEMKKKLTRSIWLELTGVSAAGASLGARWGSLKFVQWAVGPVWDLLLMLPKVGPVLGGIKAGARTMAAVSGPVGVAVALLTLNSTLGARYDAALPLLLGAGLLCRGPEMTVVVTQ